MEWQEALAAGTISEDIWREGVISITNYFSHEQEQSVKSVRLTNEATHAEALQKTLAHWSNELLGK
jgi:hypothetical protein